MKKLFGLLLCLSFLSANAQIKNKTNEFKDSHFSFGAIAGTSQGLGLAVRYWPNKVGIQVACLPLADEYSQMVSIGVSGLFMLREYEHADFYLNAGYHQIFGDYSNTSIFGLEPSINLNSEDGMFTVFGSFGYDLYLRERNVYGSSYSVSPGVACGFFINF